MKRVRASLAVSLLFLVGCGSKEPAAPPQSDAGEDSPVADTADAAPEVRIDTGPTPLGGEWAPFPDPECAREIAVDPAKAIPALTWAPCASGGCEELNTDWTTTDPDPLQLYGREHARLVKGVPHFYYTRRYPDGVDVEIVQPLAGPARFAMRGPRKGPCSLEFSFGEFGVALIPRVTGALPAGKEILIATKPWDGPLTPHRFAPELLGSPTYLYGSAGSSSSGKPRAART
jgi:hypothetical protein